MSVTINGTTGIAGVDGSAGTPAVQGSDTNTGIFFPAADTIAFGEGGSEIMRITSAGNVGIGTTTPAVKLDVVGAISASGAIQASGVTTNLYPLVSGTAQNSTSGTAIDFTGIPSWVKRVTVMFSGVSTSGTSNIQIQLGDSGGIETTGYLNAATISGAAVATINYTSGMAIEPANVNITASTVRHGSAKIELISGNTFVGTGTFCHSNSAFTSLFSGSKTLSDTLTQIRITTVNGTDTFDAGSINVLYE